MADSDEERKVYEKKIEKLYERAVKVGEGEIKTAASFMLSSKYMAKERYEDARMLLEMLPERSSLDKRQIESQILEKMLEAVSEVWDLKNTFLYRDVAEDISEKSEKENEKEIKKKKVKDFRKCRELCARMDSLHFQCYNNKTAAKRCWMMEP